MSEEEKKKEWEKFTKIDVRAEITRELSDEYNEAIHRVQRKYDTTVHMAEVVQGFFNLVFTAGQAVERRKYRKEAEREVDRSFG